MSEEMIFTNGLIFKLPSDRAPDFIKGSISIKPVEFIQWMRDNIEKGSEWINIDLKVGKSGKAYASLSTWKPNQTQGQGSGGSQRPPQQSQGNFNPNQGSRVDESEIPF